MNSKYDVVKCAYGIQKGMSHFENGEQCQDYIASLEVDDKKIIALSDGAGSCKYSGIAAKSIVHWILTYLEEYFDYFYYGIESDYDIVRERIVIAIKNKLENMEIPVSQCSCTLLAVALSCDGRWLALHVGDGIIFSDSANQGVLSYPENGKYANETFFVNDKDLSKHLRIYSGREEGKISFMIISDGCGNALFERGKGKPAEAVELMYSWLYNNPPQYVERAIERALREEICHFSEDDLSIGIILKNNKDDEKND